MSSTQFLCKVNSLGLLNKGDQVLFYDKENVQFSSQLGVGGGIHVLISEWGFFGFCKQDEGPCDLCQPFSSSLSLLPVLPLVSNLYTQTVHIVTPTCNNHWFETAAPERYSHMVVSSGSHELHRPLSHSSNHFNHSLSYQFNSEIFFLDYLLFKHFSFFNTKTTLYWGIAINNAVVVSENSERTQPSLLQPKSVQRRI